MEEKNTVVRFHHTLDGICKAAENSRIFINHDGLVYKCGWINQNSIPICDLNMNSKTDFNDLFENVDLSKIQCILKEELI